MQHRQSPSSRPHAAQHSTMSLSDALSALSLSRPSDRQDQFPDFAATSSESVRQPGRRGSWQDDAEAIDCPVCNISFTFFRRKHHCRACGIVVCSTCSGHRLTLPRSRVVRPEPDEFDDPDTADGNIHHHVHHDQVEILETFEDVRVCAICADSLPVSTLTGTGLTSRRRATAPSSGHSGSGFESTGNPGRRSHMHTRSADLNHSFIRSSPSSGSADTPTGSAGLLCLTYRPTGPRPAGPWNSSSGRYPHPTPAGPAHSRYRGRDRHRPRATVESEPTTPPPPPRPQVADEDVCPVCSAQLPARGVDGDESNRERHVQQCIEACLGPSRPTDATDAGQPQAQPRSPSGQTTSTSTGPSDPTGGHHAESTRRTSLTAQPGYHVVSDYTASAKDCIGCDGEVYECTICMEDLQVGQPVTLLNCFCRFHYHCLADWFGKCRELARPGGSREGKRPGCPTHAHIVV